MGDRVGKAEAGTAPGKEAHCPRCYKVLGQPRVDAESLLCPLLIHFENILGVTPPSEKPALCFFMRFRGGCLVHLFLSHCRSVLPALNSQQRLMEKDAQGSRGPERALFGSAGRGREEESGGRGCEDETVTG